MNTILLSGENINGNNVMITENTRYDSANQPTNDFDSSSSILSDLHSSKLEVSAETLTPQEQRLHEILSQTLTDNHWGEAIRRVVETGSVTRFRELIKDLKSQGEDGPEVMEAIIGSEAMKLLKFFS